MDTDGSAANGGSASFHTSSRALAEDVRFLVQSLGGTATLNVKADARGHKDQFCLHLALPSDVIPFRLSRKRAAFKQRKHPLGRTIVAVERCGREPVRCITVDAADGLYITDDCVVTHNSAHYEHPELIEAALLDNTNVQVDISSVNGIGNVFHRRRDAGVLWVPGATLEKTVANVFVMDWRDHPAKDQAWYHAREAKAIADGILHLHRREIDRDYSAAIEGIIIPGEWVKAAIDAHVKLGWPDEGIWGAALDVADSGGDRNALATRKGPLLMSCEEWGARDTGVTTRKAIAVCQPHLPLALQYDAIGVGSGVKAEANRLRDEQVLPDGLRLVAWNAGGEVLDPEQRVIPGDPNSVKNRDFFANVKAQGWWQLRLRFERTFRAVTEGVKYHHDELISLPSTLPKVHQVTKELSQPTASQGARLKMVVDKAPEGTKSPNMGDAIMMAFWPMREFVPSRAFVGTYGVGREDD
jgi:hypothetical protein